MSSDDQRLAVVDTVEDSDMSDLPFGKRWRHELVTLTPEHLEALRQGRLVAIDVQEVHVGYLE